MSYPVQSVQPTQSVLFEDYAPEGNVDNIVTLASSGVLVQVDMNIWSATKTDKDISSEVTYSKNADPRAGRFTKNLLAGNAYIRR